MSRSKKKNNITKIYGRHKRIYNKLVRRVNKYRIRCGLEPINRNSILNQWDYIDYRSINNNNNKYRRK